MSALNKKPPDGRCLVLPTFGDVPKVGEVVSPVTRATFDEMLLLDMLVQVEHSVLIDASPEGR